MTNGPSNARQGKEGGKTKKRGKRGGDSFAETSASGNEREGRGGAKRNNMEIIALPFLLPSYQESQR